jgi:hypothetical protein
MIRRKCIPMPKHKLISFLLLSFYHVENIRNMQTRFRGFHVGAQSDYGLWGYNAVSSSEEATGFSEYL